MFRVNQTRKPVDVYVMGLGPLVLGLIRDKGRLLRGQVKPCLGVK